MRRTAWCTPRIPDFRRETGIVHDYLRVALAIRRLSAWLFRRVWVELLARTSSRPLANSGIRCVAHAEPRSLAGTVHEVCGRWWWPFTRLPVLDWYRGGDTASGAAKTRDETALANGWPGCLSDARLDSRVQLRRAVDGAQQPVSALHWKSRLLIRSRAWSRAENFLVDGTLRANHLFDLTRAHCLASRCRELS